MKRRTSQDRSAGNILRIRRIPRGTLCCSVFILLTSLAVFVAIAPASAQSSPVDLLLGLPGAAIVAPSTISTGIPIINDGTAAATQVSITTLMLMGSTLASPTLPFSLGRVSDDGATTPLFATFTNPNAFPGGQYTLTVGGTYKVGSTTYSFTLTGTVQIPAAAPGSSVSQTVSIAPNPLKGPFPPEPPSLTAEDADTPGWVVPIGPVVPATPSASTLAQNQPRAAAGQPSHSTPSGPTVTFLLNQSLSNTVGHGYPTEPSGASAVSSSGGQTVVFVTANSDAVYSVNGGTTFAKVNPTTIFPNNYAGGFCCDQIVQYVPSIDRFVWLMQFSRGTTNGQKVGNLQRLAVARPADIVSNVKTAWTYWDLTSADFGLGTQWMDYPDLAVGDNNLYISVDAFGSPQGGLMVIRVPLSQLKAGGTIDFRYTTPLDSASAWGAHLTQNTGDTIFWAGNRHTSGLRVFSWPESSTSYSWTDIPIFSWSNSNFSSITPPPGVHDWMTKLSGFPRSSVIGATRSTNDLWMAWSAGTDSNFPYPHVEMVDLDISHSFNLKQQVQIWNSSYAFAYPALFTSSTGEIGLSLEYGGGGNFENHVVGFWSDFLVYITTSSSIGTNRFGDYVTIRPDANSKYFDAFGYGMKDVSGSGQPDVHYIIFGR